MVIKSLELSNFRNFRLLDINFDAKTNILYGDNAQGKTNILEAIYLCATTKSHRGTKDRDIVAFDEEESHIRIFLDKKGDEVRIDMHLRKNGSKGIAIDGQKLKRASQLLGVMNVVFFFTGGPFHHQERPGGTQKICGYGAVPAGPRLSAGLKQL